MNSQTQGASNDYYQQGAQQMDQRPGNQAKAQGYGQGQQQPNSQGVNTQSGQPAGAGLPPQAAEQQDGLHKCKGIITDAAYPRADTFSPGQDRKEVWRRSIQ